MTVMWREGVSLGAEEGFTEEAERESARQAGVGRRREKFMPGKHHEERHQGSVTQNFDAHLSVSQCEEAVVCLRKCPRVLENNASSAFVAQFSINSN